MMVSTEEAMDIAPAPSTSGQTVNMFRAPGPTVVDPVDAAMDVTPGEQTEAPKVELPDAVAEEEEAAAAEAGPGYADLVKTVDKKKMLSFLLKIRWLEEGQTLRNLTDVQKEQIVQRWDSFSSAVNAEGGAE